MKRVLLIILDGFGLSPNPDGNAPYLAKTPTLDSVFLQYPKTLLSASGLSVGVNSSESGNSEVGHLNLGSGRVVWESLPRIDQAISDESFFQNLRLLKMAEKVKKNNSSLHLIGLCSNGGVHSSLNHLFALLDFAKQNKIKKVFIHMITDGRDTAPKSAKNDVIEIENKIKKLGIGKIATIIGRFYVMDRDKHFERTAKAYNLFASGAGDKYQSAVSAIDANYRAGADDEKIGPSIINSNGTVKSGDGIIFFNFRTDRTRQILEPFENENYFNFQKQNLANLEILTMTKYSEAQKSLAIFPPINLANVVADLLPAKNLSQCHIAETEKYAHVTYFFNGGNEKPHEKEDWVLVPSPRVESYAEKPEMSAFEISDKVLNALEKNYQFILVNFANGDMVGHTGDLSATILAVETVDKCLAKILPSASNLGITTIITADHGNCEIMIDPATKEVNKEHTTSPVPFALLDFQKKPFSISAVADNKHLLEFAAEPVSGILADVAPTVLNLLNIAKPPEMSGIDLESLI